MKIAIILYKSKTLADGSHPLMVRVSQLKSRKYLSTGLSCPAEWWDAQKQLPKRSHPDRKLIEGILIQKKATYHQKCLELESEQKALSIHQFVEAITRPKQDTEGVFPFLEEVIKGMMDRGKIGRARLYKRLDTLLQAFIGNKQLAFNEIDSSFLKRYEGVSSRKGI